MKNKSLILPIYIILVIVMFVLPFFSAEGYSIVSNTTSQLGAQQTPNAWVMNVTFALLGLACIREAFKHLKGHWLQKVLLITFGVGLFFTALFHHAPIDGSLPFSLREDSLHSIFASIVGFSFIAFAISAAFIETANQRRIIALAMGFFAAFLSLLMAFLPDYSGIWQRVMFIVSFAWLMFFFRGRRAIEIPA